MHDDGDDAVIISSTEHTPKKQNDEQTAAPAGRRGEMAQMRLEAFFEKRVLSPKKRGPGRPRKSKRRNSKAQPTTPLTTEKPEQQKKPAVKQKPTAKQKPAAEQKPAKRRWHEGDNLQLLADAVSNWDNKCGKFEHGISKAEYALACGIPAVSKFDTAFCA